MAHMHSLNAMERIHVVFSCDHVKGQSRTAIKMLLMDADRDDSRVLKEGVSSIGNINHTKDDYPILQATIFPKFNEMIDNLQLCGVCGDEDNNYFIPNIPNIPRVLPPNVTKHIKTKFFICSDYKFVAECQGKPGRSPHWCPFCDIALRIVKSDKDARGQLWTSLRWHEKLQIDSNVASINRGIVNPTLLSSIEAINYLIAILHQLLGTGNDIRKEILHIADTLFETWAADLVQLNGEVIEAEADRDSKRDTRERLKTQLGQLKETLKQLKSNYQHIRRHNHTQLLQDYFNQQKQILDQEISAKQIQHTQSHRLAVDSGLAHQKLNQKLKTIKSDREYKDKPVRIRVYNIFNAHKITPQQYHGGDFVGPHVRKFMAEADEICSKIGTEFKSVPLNERRIKEDEEEVMSDQSIDVMIRTWNFK